MARITVLELPATWGDPKGALKRVDELVARDPATHLVVCPEASFTGYVSPDGDWDLRPFAEPIDGPTAAAIRGLAKRHRVHLVAPLVLEERGSVFNTMVVASPSGAIDTIYRKRHPWSPEREWVTRGTLPHPVFSVADLSVSIAICYDLHFLAHEEETRETLARIDLLLFPSAWVDEEETRIPTLAALAATFGCAVAAANWCEGVVQVPGQGESCILDAKGRPLAIAEPGVSRIDAVLGPRSSISR